MAAVFPLYLLLPALCGAGLIETSPKASVTADGALGGRANRTLGKGLLRASDARTRALERKPEAPPIGPVFGDESVKEAFKVWLSSWRNLYVDPGSDNVPLLEDGDLPEAFSGVDPKVVLSTGGVAGGVVTEGMGYGIMIEGMMAAQGDGWARVLGLGLMRSWMGMVQGPVPDKPLGGSSDSDGSATRVDGENYGASVVTGPSGPAGVATWKFPRDLCAADSPWLPCHGSAADGDVDAVLGMIYLAGAHNYPDDFVDVVMRMVISFASADLGFPDMYRTLPDGKRVYVPKAGSQWGGLTPPDGPFKTTGPEWCYNPAYFAPGHYRAFRDFAKAHWRPHFDEYLPPHLGGKGERTTLKELVAAFDGAILAGYNILYYSSCESGTVSNWVGVEASCEDNALSCKGVPWEYTPYVGKHQGQCSQSATKWGAFGADATRSIWRIAMDHALYTEESEKVDIYWRSGWVNQDIYFNARVFLNRIVTQYRHYSECDGGVEGGCGCHYPGCIENETKAYWLNAAFATDKWPRTPGLTCPHVPHHGQAWWAGFMSYPTFTAFVAPYRDEVSISKNASQNLKPMTARENQLWMATFAHLCNFSGYSEEGGWEIAGKVCQKTYFHVSQEAISTMIMSGSLTGVPRASKLGVEDTVMKDSLIPPVAALAGTSTRWLAAAAGALLVLAAALPLLRQQWTRGLGGKEEGPCETRQLLCKEGIGETRQLPCSNLPSASRPADC